MSANKIPFDPMALPGCLFCEAIEIKTTPAGRKYTGAPLGCCLLRSLHEANVLQAITRQAGLEDKQLYQQDLATNLAAIKRHLAGVSNPSAALAEAKKTLTQDGKRRYQADVTSRVLQMLRGAA